MEEEKYSEQIILDKFEDNYWSLDVNEVYGKKRKLNNTNPFYLFNNTKLQNKTTSLPYIQVVQF